jgi:hypothetical protein
MRDEEEKNSIELKTTAQKRPDAAKVDLVINTNFILTISECVFWQT